MHYSVFICGNSITNAEKMKTLDLWSDMIDQHCLNGFEAKDVKIMWYVNTTNV